MVIHTPEEIIRYIDQCVEVNGYALVHSKAPFVTRWERVTEEVPGVLGCVWGRNNELEVRRIGKETITRIVPDMDSQVSEFYVREYEIGTIHNLVLGSVPRVMVRNCMVQLKTGEMFQFKFQGPRTLHLLVMGDGQAKRLYAS